MAPGIRLGLGAGAVLASLAVIGAASAIGYQKTTTFAGYAFYSSKVTTATARFSIPRVTCSVANRGVGPGVFIVTTRGQLTGIGIVVACIDFAPQYKLVSVANNRQLTMPFASVRPGDVLVTQIHLSTAESVITAKDLRTNIVGRRAGPGSRSAYVSIGSAGLLNGKNVQLGVDPFTPVRFSDVVIQGKALARWRPVALERYRGSASHPVVQIRPSRLAHGGEAFTLSFVHS